LSRPENIAMSAPQHVTDKVPAMAGLANDLLDRHAVPGESQDCGIGLFPS
jgi:hypothetical protein